MKFEKIEMDEAICCLGNSTLSQVEEALKETPLPKRSTANSAGYDFYSPISVKAKAGEVVRIPLLVRICDMPANAVLMIFNRSGLSLKKGLRLDNAVGIIDADYKLCIWFQATANSDIEIKAGDKICQGIFLNFLTVDNDDATGDRNGGFGSTGR